MYLLVCPEVKASSVVAVLEMVGQDRLVSYHSIAMMQLAMRQVGHRGSMRPFVDRWWRIAISIARAYSDSL